MNHDGHFRHQNEHRDHHAAPESSGEAKVYTCPMHPNVRQDTPGLCPECGMNLIKSKTQGAGRNAAREAYDKHAGHSVVSFARKFLVSLMLTVPVVLYSELPEKFFGWMAPVFPCCLAQSFFSTAAGCLLPGPCAN